MAQDKGPSKGKPPFIKGIGNVEGVGKIGSPDWLAAHLNAPSPQLFPNAPYDPSGAFNVAATPDMSAYSDPTALPALGRGDAPVDPSGMRQSELELAARAEAARLPDIIPHHLAQEQPTIIAGRFDEVTAMVEQFNVHAKRLASKYGVHGNPLRVEDPQDRMKDLPTTGGVTPMVVLSACAFAFAEGFSDKEYFQLTRVGDVGWGIYYKYVPSPLAKDKAKENVQLITGCRVDIKRAFLRRSGIFFKEYLEEVSRVVGKIESDLSGAADVLRALDRVE